MREEQRDRWGSALLLILLVALVFGSTLGFSFLDWDDNPTIVFYPLVRHPLRFGVGALLATRELGYPQPLPVLTQHLDWLMGGGTAWPFHLTNLCWHAANALVVRSIALGYGLTRRAGLFAGALFAVHPIVAETVSWATGRKDLIAAFFVLAGFAAYRATRRSAAPLARWLPLGAIGLALAAKPIGVVLPVLILADRWISRTEPALPLRRLPLAVMVVVGAAAVTMAYRTQAAVGALSDGHSIAARLSFAAQHLALQSRNYAWPLRLSPKYLEELPRALGTAWGIAGLLVTVTFAAVLAGSLGRGRRRLAFAVAWFLTAFAPSSGLVALTRGAADSYVYLASFGAALGIALAYDAAATRMRAAVRSAVALAVVATLAFTAHVQSQIWRSPITLWKSVVELYPEHRRSWFQYANAFLIEGRAREAIAVYEEGLRQFSEVPSAEVRRSLCNGCRRIGDACADRWCAADSRLDAPQDAARGSPTPQRPDGDWSQRERP